MQQIGVFESSDAKRIVGLLEARQIPFALEADDSALFAPNRGIDLAYGAYPDGSKIIVLVPTSRATDAEEVLRTLFHV